MRVFKYSKLVRFGNLRKTYINNYRYLPVLSTKPTIFLLITRAFNVLDFSISWVVVISSVLIIKTFCLKNNNYYHKYCFINILFPSKNMKDIHRQNIFTIFN